MKLFAIIGLIMVGIVMGMFLMCLLIICGKADKKIEEMRDESQNP